MSSVGFDVSYDSVSVFIAMFRQKISGRRHNAFPRKDCWTAEAGSDLAGGGFSKGSSRMHRRRSQPSCIAHNLRYKKGGINIYWKI